jgi:hypothetical protein
MAFASARRPSSSLCTSSTDTNESEQKSWARSPAGSRSGAGETRSGARTYSHSAISTSTAFTASSRTSSSPTGLHPADGLVGLPRTIFDSPDEAHYYDQIAWFTDPRKGPALTLRCTGAKYFDFVPLLQDAMTKTHLSWHALITTRSGWSFRRALPFKLAQAEQSGRV